MNFRYYKVLYTDLQDSFSCFTRDENVKDNLVNSENFKENENVNNLQNNTAKNEKDTKESSAYAIRKLYSR